MNPLTLDFIRRWKWLLVAQFSVVAVAWIFHAEKTQARLHLEMAVAVVMSWELMRGFVRVQAALPQRAGSVAAGLWLSVVGTGAAVQISAMLAGGAVLAPLFGKAVDPGALGLHAVLSILMIGTAQFFLTGLPASAPRTLAGQVKAGFFGLMWGLSVWGFFALAFLAPRSWAEVSTVQAAVMVLLGGCAAASWFTTRTMMRGRAVPVHGASGRKKHYAPEVEREAGPVWLVRLTQEGRWFLPVTAMVVLAAAIMISINWQTVHGGWPWQIRATEYIYRSMGMLCVMTVFPLAMVSVGTLRACRGLPGQLRQWALLVAFRPFVAGLIVFGLFTMMITAVNPSMGMDWNALAAFLPLCGGLSLVQAVMVRHPRLPVVVGLLMLISMLGTSFTEMFRDLRQGAPVLLVVAAVLQGLSCWLHVRWLGKGSRIYRVNAGFLRMAGAAQR